MAIEQTKLERLREKVQPFISTPDSGEFAASEATLLDQFSDILKKVAKKVHESAKNEKSEIPFSQADMTDPVKKQLPEQRVSSTEKPANQKESSGEIVKESSSGERSSEEDSEPQTDEVEESDSEDCEESQVEGSQEGAPDAQATKESSAEEGAPDAQATKESSAEAAAAQVKQETEVKEEVSAQASEEVSLESVEAAPDTAADGSGEAALAQVLELKSEEKPSDVKEGSEAPAATTQLLSEEVQTESQAPSEATATQELAVGEKLEKPKLPGDITATVKSFVPDQVQTDRPKVEGKSLEENQALELLLQETKVAMLEHSAAPVLTKDPGYLTAQLIRQSIQSVQEQVRDVGNAADAPLKVGAAVKAIASASNLIQGTNSANLNPNSKNNDSAEVRSERAQKEATALPKRLAARTLERVENVVREVIKSKEGKSVTLRLDPPELGKIRVDVTRTDTGVHARLVAENPQVNSLLRDKSGQLQLALRKLGLDAENVTVSVGSDSASQQFEHSHDDRRQSSRGTKVLVQEEGVSAGEVAIAIPTGKATQNEDHWVA